MYSRNDLVSFTCRHCWPALSQDTTEILHEVEVMMKLKHRNIVQLYGLWTREGQHIGTRVYMVGRVVRG